MRDTNWVFDSHQRTHLSNWNMYGRFPTQISDLGLERETERETERERDRDRQRQRQRETERETETDRETERERSSYLDI